MSEDKYTIYLSSGFFDLYALTISATGENQACPSVVKAKNWVLGTRTSALEAVVDYRHAGNVRPIESNDSRGFFQ